jgi:serine/threonine protein kinase
MKEDRAEYSSKVDIWALGVILHELVTGTKPWKSDGAVMDYYRSKQQLEIVLNDGFGELSKTVVCKSIRDMFQRRSASRPNASELFRRFSAQYELAVAMENTALDARTAAMKDYLTPPLGGRNTRHGLKGPLPMENVASSGSGTTKPSASVHPKTLRRLHELATEFHNSKLWKDAETFCEEIDTPGNSLVSDRSDAIASRGHLTFKYGTLRQHQEALEMHMEIVRKGTKELGPDDPQTLLAQHNLAITYAYGGQYEDAAHLYEDTIERRKKVLGPNHPDTLASEKKSPDAVCYTRPA